MESPFDQGNEGTKGKYRGDISDWVLVREMSEGN